LQFPSKPVRSQKVKQLVASMLQVNEKDRPPWDMIFEDPTIRIEEAKIKRNMEELLAQKDTSLRSISLNKLYIDQNLVIGYLANNPINSLEQSGDK
jgi:serine/threonine-protein kinase ULK/ATG1